jgi:hypothetical protein
MTEPLAAPPVSVAVLRQRLGWARFGASRPVKAVAELADGESLVAVVLGMWRRRTWGVVATDSQLFMARRPRLRAHEQRVLDWRDLVHVESESGRVIMRFGAEEVSLICYPKDEVERLAEHARTHVRKLGVTPAHDLHELARSTLGALYTLSLRDEVGVLSERLKPGERVEWFALSRLEVPGLDFAGVLALTDRRVLMAELETHRSKHHAWEVDRDEILATERMSDGLRLKLRHGDAELTSFRPRKRLDEFIEQLGVR